MLLPEPDDEEVGILAATVRRRVLRLLHRRGVLDEGCQEPDLLLMNEPSLARLYGASVQGRLAVGRRAGQRVQRSGALPGAGWVEMDSPQCARVEGFSLHARVCVPQGDIGRLEGLCRYLTRSPIANSRLSEMGDGKLCYELKRPWSDGTHHVVFEPLEMLEKVVALIPRPWTHLVRYHGVFAPNHRLRSRVIPPPPSKSQEQNSGAIVSTTHTSASSAATGRCRRRVLPWAELMRRVFMVDVLMCQACGGSMTIISVLTDPEVVEPFLVCLGVSHVPPQTAPAARGSP